MLRPWPEQASVSHRRSPLGGIALEVRYFAGLWWLVFASQLHRRLSMSAVLGLVWTSKRVSLWFFSSGFPYKLNVWVSCLHRLQPVSLINWSFLFLLCNDIVVSFATFFKIPIFHAHSYWCFMHEVVKTKLLVISFFRHEKCFFNVVLII